MRVREKTRKMLVQNREPYLKVRYYVIRAKKQKLFLLFMACECSDKNGPISNQENVNKNKKILAIKINARARENSFNGNPARLRGQKTIISGEKTLFLLSFVEVYSSRCNVYYKDGNRILENFHRGIVRNKILFCFSLITLA